MKTLKKSFCLYYFQSSYIIMMCVRHQTKKIHYKNCFVPWCKNTTTSAPDKLYFFVPRDVTLRNLWFQAVGRKYLAPNSSVYCCEDHFNIEQDTQNYIQYKIMALEGHKVTLKLKKDALPRILQSQNDNGVESACGTKEVFLEDDENLGNTGTALSYIITENNIKIENDEEIQGQIKIEFEDGPTVVGFENKTNCETDPSTSILYNYKHNIKIEPTDNSEYKMDCEPASTAAINIGDTRNMQSYLSLNVAPPVTQEIKKPIIYKADKLVQVNLRPKYRSKAINVDFPIKSNTNAATMTSQSLILDYEEQLSAQNIKKILKDGVVKTDYQFKQLMRCTTRAAIEREPELLLGLPKTSYHIINFISETLNIPTVDVLITLRKIKLNESINVLGLNFGYKEKLVTRIFLTSAPYIAEKLKDMVVWPNPTEIFEDLPEALSKQYSNVISMIDFLEVQVCNPSGDDNLSVIKSENNVKYLISCTAGGIINFVSSGYSGETNVTILEESGFLECLPPGKAVMADERFKDISPSLKSRNCTIVQSPVVSKSISSLESFVKLSKKIGSFHIESVMTKLREFNMLQPHIHIDSSLLPVIDDIVVIACCLINISTGCPIKI